LLVYFTCGSITNAAGCNLLSLEENFLTLGESLVSTSGFWSKEQFPDEVVDIISMVIYFLQLTENK
jgi:hypothetical protein